MKRSRTPGRWRAPLRIGALLLILSACSAAPDAVLRSPALARERPVQPTVVLELPTTQPTIAPATPTIAPAPPSAVADPTAELRDADPLPAADLGFDGERAFGYLEAQMQWIPRHTGTPGWQQNGDYIVQQMQAAGWQVEEQRFPYQGVTARNIIAKRGSGPLLILGAHYDSRKYADNDPDPANRTKPVPAANDGASGVAVLIELARHIDTDQLGREVWLAFFDAEDNGEIEGWEWIVGSTYMAENLPRQPQAMVLVDMIGDKDLNIYYESNSTPWLRESIWRRAEELGYAQFIPSVKYSMIDDHTPFLDRGIPAADLIDFDYPPWHTIADTADKTSAASLEAVGRTLERWLDTRARP